MTDVAKIGFEVDTAALRRAREELAKFKKSGYEAGDSVDQFGRKVENAEDKTRRLGDRVSMFDRIIGRARTSIIAFGVSMAAAFAFQAMIGDALAFSQAIGEVSTIAVSDIDGISDAARRMGVEFGTGAVVQAKAFYDAISAGGAAARDTATTMNLLDVANRAAVGGAADLSATTAILAAAMNAYSDAGQTAADAADILFIGAGAGATSIGALAGALGRVIPAATALNLPFDQLVGSVAALTTVGQGTEEAVTGINAALSQLINPAQQARELAASLGIEFNAAGLQSRGLSDYLQYLIEKTNGNSEALAILFQSTQAARAVLAFAGVAGENFGNIMGEMADRAGAADAAFELMSATLNFRFNAAMAKFRDVALGVGQILLAVLVPAMEAVVFALNFVEDNIELVTAAAIGATPILLGMFGPPVIGAIMGFGRAVLTYAVGSINALTAAIARNPLGLLLTIVSSLIGYFVSFRDSIKPVSGEIATLGDYFTAFFELVVPIIQSIGEWFGNLWTGIKDAAGVAWKFISDGLSWLGGIVYDVINNMIAIFVSGFETIRIIWQSLPAIVGEVAVNTANAVIDGIEWIVQQGINALNWFIEQANKIPGVDIAMMADVSLGNIENPWAGTLDDVANDVIDRVQAAFNTDYLGEAVGFIGDLFSGIRERANELAALRAEAEATVPAVEAVAAAAEETSAAIGGISEAAKNAAKELEESFRASVKGFLSDLKDGMGILEAASNALENFANKIFDLWLQNLFATSATGGGPFAAIAAMIGYADGGYTGNNGRGEVAGVVHGQEFVVNATATGKYRPILEAMNDNNYRADGSNISQMHPSMAGRGVHVTLINNSREELDATASADENGDLTIMLDSAMSELISKPGSRTRKALKGAMGGTGAR